MTSHSLITGLLNVALLIQSPSKAPLRLGGGAQQLAESDIATIEMLLPGNVKPWLYGDVDPTPGTATPVMGAFLPATTETPELRRGPLVTLLWPGHAPDSRGWTVMDANGSYAQVAVAGRNFDQIQGNQAVNRPFRVQGVIADADLLKIVSIVRARISRAQLLSIERNDRNQILVSLGFERVVLENKNQEWVIVSGEVIRPPGSSNSRQPQSLTPPQTILSHVESAPQ